MYSQSRRGVREHTHKYKLTKTLAVASKAIAGCERIAETHIKGVESELRGIKSSPPSTVSARENYCTSGLLNFPGGHTSPVTYFLVGLSASLRGSKAASPGSMGCVTLTNVYNKEAF